MHHPQEHCPGFLVLLFDIVLHNIREGAIASLITLYDLPTLFVDYNDMVVLVNDLHTSILRFFNFSILYMFIPPST